MPDELLHEVRDDIGTIARNRPRARNALTFAPCQFLAEIAADPGEARVLVLAGAEHKGGAPGISVGESRGAVGAIASEARLDRMLGMPEGCAVPTIAAIAAGGAGSADFREGMAAFLTSDLPHGEGYDNGGPRRCNGCLADLPTLRMSGDHLSLSESVRPMTGPNRRPVPVANDYEAAPW